MVQKILDYWYALEFFNPCWPVKPKQDTNLLLSELPWLKPQDNPKIRVSYDVYFGRAASNDLIVWLLGQLGLSPEEMAIENDNSITCLCALKLDQDGRYVAGSFALSSFVWAIGSLANAGLIGAKLKASELEEIQAVINNKLLNIQENEAAPAICRKELFGILTLSREKAMIAPNLIETSLWSRRKDRKSVV